MGRSALSFASQHGHSDVVALLADSGAQLNLKTHVCILRAFTLHLNIYFEALSFHCMYGNPTKNSATFLLFCCVLLMLDHTSGTPGIYIKSL